MTSIHPPSEAPQETDPASEELLVSGLVALVAIVAFVAVFL